MTFSRSYLIPRALIGVMGLVMLAATIPAYGNPTMNPGLIHLEGVPLSLGDTAGAFLGRQLTVIAIALIGAFGGQRLLVLIGAFGMAAMNGHDALFMGLAGGEDMRVAAIAGLVFAALGVVSMLLVWRSERAA